MDIIWTNDENYPIQLDNGWNTGDLSAEFLKDQDEWDQFINDLQKARAEYLARA